MQLFNNNILIKLDEEKTQLGNGLAVKETRGKRDIVQGTVKNVPSGFIQQDILGPGDQVLFPLYAATQVTIDGELYVVANFEDIILKK